jgi:hypothetical protein
MVMSDTSISTPAAALRRGAWLEPATSTVDWPSDAVDPPASATGTNGRQDAVALVWDLTVHRLYQAFAECLPGPVDGTNGGPTPRPRAMSAAGAAMAGVRLAATRHAVNDIQEALDRMADGSYGVCQQCAQPINAERLHATPTTRWCPTCQADRCG